KPMKRLEQMRLDEELAFKLQAEKEEEEEERLATEKAQQVEEANIAWDDVQSKIEADYQLAQRLQAQEQEELTDAKKRTRHYQRKYRYIREVIRDGEIVLKKVHIDDNVTDPFTKPMPYTKHFEHAMGIRVRPASSLI
ncbi:hypothetical protein Tco_1537898, partial [Tanacetum coccineum]